MKTRTALEDGRTQATPLGLAGDHGPDRVPSGCELRLSHEITGEQLQFNAGDTLPEGAEVRETEDGLTLHVEAGEELADTRIELRARRDVHLHVEGDAPNVGAELYSTHRGDVVRTGNAPGPGEEGGWGHAWREGPGKGNALSQGTPGVSTFAENGKCFTRGAAGEEWHQVREYERQGEPPDLIDRIAETNWGRHALRATGVAVAATMLIASAGLMKDREKPEPAQERQPAVERTAETEKAAKDPGGERGLQEVPRPENPDRSERAGGAGTGQERTQEICR